MPRRRDARSARSGTPPGRSRSTPRGQARRGSRTRDLAPAPLLPPCMGSGLWVAEDGRRLLDLQNETDRAVRPQSLQVELRPPGPDAERVAAANKAEEVAPDVGVDGTPDPVDDEVARHLDIVAVNLEDPDIGDEPPGARGRELAVRPAAVEAVDPSADPVDVVIEEHQ